MFDIASSLSISPPSGAAAGTLRADALTGWKDTLSAALDSDSGLDDAGRISTLRALEELVCVATAAQAQLAAELDTSQREAQAAAGVPAERLGRGIASQVALGRRESPHRGQRHLGLATIVRSELPATWAAWRAGRITEWKATLLARETGCLSLADRRAVDAAVAGDPARIEAMGDRELAAAARREGYRLDPEAHVTRRRRAEADRRVSLRPAPDTMVWLTALLPVVDGVATYAALLRAAETARAAGDPRNKGQVMADTVVGRILDQSEEPDRPAERPAHGVAVNVTMSDHSLFGTSEEPAHVEDYGPIPAELARELVAGACSRSEEVWLRRLYTHPGTGELVATDSRARLFPHGLAQLIRLRDQVCRTLWCDAPIRHTDHAHPWADDGPTSDHNGQGLCEACNHAKQARGWQARTSPDSNGHEVATTTPTGHTYRSRAPAVATIRHTPYRIDFLLTG